MFGMMKKHLNWIRASFNKKGEWEYTISLYQIIFKKVL